MSDIKCTICDKALTGGLDTFGDVRFPMCQECYWSLSTAESDPYKQLGIKCGTCRRHQSATEWEVIDQDGMSQTEAQHE